MSLVGWLPHSTNPVHAGARIRCLTPLRVLRRRGVAVELFCPAREADYHAVLVQGLRCREVAGDPFSGDGVLALVERLKARGCRIAVEDCDNHFYNPRGLPEWDAVARRLRRLVGLADHLVASTEAMAEVFRRETGTALPVTLIGDGVEEDADLNFDPAWRRAMSWRRKRDWARWLVLSAAVAMERRRGRTPIVWFGLAGASYADGGMRDLARLGPLLVRANDRQPLTLTVISNSRARYEELVQSLGVPTRYLDWTRATFLAALRLHEVAVIPVTPTPFTVCKSNNRLLLALHNGLAVCADRIPSYAAFGDVCALGRWEEGLEGYLAEPALRRDHVAAARQRIAAHWTSEAVADQWQQLLAGLTALEAAACTDSPPTQAISLTAPLHHSTAGR